MVNKGQFLHYSFRRKSAYLRASLNDNKKSCVCENENPFKFSGIPRLPSGDNPTFVLIKEILDSLIHHIK